MSSMYRSVFLSLFAAAPYQSSAGALATMVTANDVTVIFLPPSASARNGIITTYRFNIIRTVINGISSPQDFLVNSDQNVRT